MYRTSKSIAAIMAVFLLISLSCFADNVHTGAAMPAASYTYGLQQNATHPVQMLNGQPPVGYSGATGTYIPVQATAGLELPVRFVTPPSIALVSSGSIEIEPNSSTMGSGTAGVVPTTPLGILLHLSDGTNIQQWLTAVILGDGTNGNNTAAVAPWVFNGSTFDRMRGNASDGIFVSEVLCVDISTATLTITATSQDVSVLTNRKWISFQNQGTQTVCIHPNGTPAVYGSGRLLYPQGSITYNNIDDSVAFSLICDTGLSSSVFVEQGVK